MKKYKILDSLISTGIATLVYGLLIFIINNASFDSKDFLMLGAFVIITFITNIFIIQKYKKSDK